MSEYQPLAIQLRPAFFRDFVYNEPIVLILKNMVIKNQLPHGIILSGTRGIGKTTIARILARTVNCLDRKEEEHEPCGVCESCKESLAQTHPDIIEIDGATHGGIEDIRKLLEQVAHTPMVGKKKIFIVDEAHGLGRSQASWDALLKVLEEPPDHILWIFCTTQKHRIPDVIKSRLITLDLKLVPTTILVDFLRPIIAKHDLGFGKIPVEEVSQVIATAANNSIRDALTVLEKVMPYCDEKGWSKQAVLEAMGAFDIIKTAEMLNLIAQHNSPGLWALFNGLLESGVDAEPIFESIVTTINNLMAIHLGVQIEGAEIFYPFMAAFAAARIIYLCDIAFKRSRDFQFSTNKKMVLQVMAMELCA